MKLDFPYYDVKTLLIPGLIVCSSISYIFLCNDASFSFDKLTFGICALFLVASYIVGEIIQIICKFIELHLVFKRRLYMVRIVDREGNPTDKVCSMKAARYYHRKIMETIGDERYDLFLMRFVYQIAIDVKKDDKHATELLKTRANSKLFRSLSFAWLFVIAGILFSPVCMLYRIAYLIIAIIILAGIIWRYKRFSRNYAEKLYAFHYYRHKAEIDASDISERANAKEVDSADGVIQSQQPAAPNATGETRHNIRQSNSGNVSDKSGRNNQTDDTNQPGQKEQAPIENESEKKEQTSETKQEAQQEKKTEEKKIAQPVESAAPESQTTSELPEDPQSAEDVKENTPLSEVGDDVDVTSEDS